MGYASKRKPGGTDRRHTFTVFAGTSDTLEEEVDVVLDDENQFQQRQQEHQDHQLQQQLQLQHFHHHQQHMMHASAPQGSYAQMGHPMDSPPGYNPYYAGYGAPQHSGYHPQAGHWVQPGGYNPYYHPALDGPVQPMPAQKQVTGPGGANLFVFNFPRIFTNDDLLGAFAPFGSVLSATVFIDKATGRSKCFGFVSYDSAAAAADAITTMNGAQLGGKIIKVQLKREFGHGKEF
jgi:hypothetical protein